MQANLQHKTFCLAVVLWGQGVSSRPFSCSPSREGKYILGDALAGQKGTKPYFPLHFGVYISRLKTRNSPNWWVTFWGEGDWFSKHKHPFLPSAFSFLMTSPCPKLCYLWRQWEEWISGSLSEGMFQSWEVASPLELHTPALKCSWLGAGAWAETSNSHRMLGSTACSLGGQIRTIFSIWERILCSSCLYVLYNARLLSPSTVWGDEEAQVEKSSEPYAFLAPEQ